MPPPRSTAGDTLSQTLFRWCAVIAALTMGIAVAQAGPNRWGVLVLSESPSVFTTDTPDFCGTLGVEACDDITVRHDGPSTVLLNVLAAFPYGSSPRLSGVVFGLAYDAAAVFLPAFGSCGDFELPSTNWPGPYEGTAVTWNEAQTTILVEVYWIAAYNYYSPGPQTLALIPHPNQGGLFADDDVPSNIDPIRSFGVFGFDTDGSIECPFAIGACCLRDGSCYLEFEEFCGLIDGHYQGDATVCEPNPCPWPIGQCCFPDGSCDEVLREECESSGGRYSGDGTYCALGCDGPRGACCLPDSTCLVLRWDRCEFDYDGSYLGHGVDCEPSSCTQTSGACCYLDGSCQVLPQDDCMSSNGMYQGDDTDCQPNPCPEAMGACCLADECRVSNPEYCDAVDGTYQGHGTDCDPNPCEEVPTLRRSWGQIKNAYR